MKEDLFDEVTYINCLERINNINSNTKAQWGSMDVAQMFAHCAEIQEVTNGKKIESPFFLKLLSPFIKKMVIKGEYKKSTRTHPKFLQNTPKDFEEEKTRLIISIKTFNELGREKSENIIHSFFGKMTSAEKGRAMFKHLDYHLNQFGV